MILASIEFYAGDARKNSPARARTTNTAININTAETEGEYLKLDFQYVVSYGPDKSYLRLNGLAYFKGKEADKCYKEWKKTKRISGPDGEEIINALYFHSSINGLLLSRAFNLAPALNLPRIRFGEEKKKRKKK